MSNKHFTDEQIKELEANPYVVKATCKYIKYSEEFKELFLIDYNNEMLPIDIFKKYDFDTNVIKLRNDTEDIDTKISVSSFFEKIY